MIADAENLRPRRTFLMSIALVLVVIAVYHAAPSHDFINFDDNQYVTRSDITQRGLTMDGIKWAFTDVSTGNWHPLTRLSHMADCAVFGLNPGAHHAVNVAIHALNAVLVLLALHRLTCVFWRSAIVAALFALHPLHAESVAWIAERKDVLCGFFWIAAMFAYARYTEHRSIPRYLIVALLFAFALMSKPMAVTLPAALLLLDVWPLNRLTAPVGFTKAFAKCLGLLALEKLPLFALSIGAGVLTVSLQGHAINRAETLTLALRVQNAFAAYGVYLRQTVWPADLAIFYPHPMANLSTGAWVAGAAIVAIISVVAVATVRRAPFVFTGWFWFVGTLVPVIGIVQAGLQGHADRYTYLPHIGLFIALVWSAAWVVQRIRIPTPVVAVATTAVLASLAVVSARQHAYWKDAETVFQRALSVTEDNQLAHLILGTEYAKRGDLDTAEQHYYAAIQIGGASEWTENLPEGCFALGLLAERQHDWDEAVRQYTKAFELDDRFDAAYNNLAGVFMELGRTGDAAYFQQARALATQALAINPENHQAAANAAFLALHFRDYAEAVRLHERALPHFPDNAAMHRNMGLALFGHGEPQRAIEYAQRALAIDPAFHEAKADIARYRAGL